MLWVASFSVLFWGNLALLFSLLLFSCIPGGQGQRSIISVVVSRRRRRRGMAALDGSTNCHVALDDSGRRQSAFYKTSFNNKIRRTTTVLVQLIASQLCLVHTVNLSAD